MSDKNQVKSERCRKECVMRFSDMHVHSTFSSDGKSSMNEHCEIAKQKKLKSICFTEHVDLNDKEINLGKSKLLDFPTMPTTAESLPLLISFFPYTLNLYLVNAIMSLFKL